MMKRMLCLLMAVLVLLPCIALGDSLWIIPDSNTRKLTREELWEYKYDTLKYAFNEIYARHGYKFETGSPCYMWFTQMPWYTPNENETSKNHHESYSQCNSIENYNVDLIKDVRREMKAMNTLNPNGKGLPTPPDQNVDKPRGFSYVALKGGQKLAVYSAPSTAAYRANNGKAMCNTNGAVYALGWDNGWMLMLYEANYAGQYRVGYIDGAAIKGTRPNLQTLEWEMEPTTLTETANLTDDPAQTGKTMITLPAGTKVTYLTTMYNAAGWDYIETTIDGQTARGFVPHGVLGLTFEEDGEG